MNKSEKRAMECIKELHKQIEQTLIVLERAVVVMGGAIELLLPEKEGALMPPERAEKVREELYESRRSEA
jgi:hypothetical protein